MNLLSWLTQNLPTVHKHDVHLVLLTIWTGPFPNDSYNSIIFLWTMFKCAVRVDGVVFQLLGSYCGQRNPSPAKRRFANDEEKLFWRYLLSNQYTWWNKFTSEKIAFDVDYAFVLLTSQIVLFCTWERRSRLYFSQILGLFNQVISRGTEYITRAMDIQVIVFPLMRMRFSHFLLSDNLNWSILVCSCQKRENTTNSSNKKRKYSVQRKLRY